MTVEMNEDEDVNVIFRTSFPSLNNIIIITYIFIYMHLYDK